MEFNPQTFFVSEPNDVVMNQQPTFAEAYNTHYNQNAGQELALADYGAGANEANEVDLQQEHQREMLREHTVEKLINEFTMRLINEASQSFPADLTAMIGEPYYENLNNIYAKAAYERRALVKKAEFEKCMTDAAELLKKGLIARVQAFALAQRAQELGEEQRVRQADKTVAAQARARIKADYQKKMRALNRSARKPSIAQAQIEYRKDPRTGVFLRDGNGDLVPALLGGKPEDEDPEERENIAIIRAIARETLSELYDSEDITEGDIDEILEEELDASDEEDMDVQLFREKLRAYKVTNLGRRGTTHDMVDNRAPTNAFYMRVEEEGEVLMKKLREDLNKPLTHKFQEFDAGAFVEEAKSVDFSEEEIEEVRKVIDLTQEEASWGSFGNRRGHPRGSKGKKQ
jgi:hypothetical protein